jgi:glycosyltransferase involved in cell wall biosynthesis
LNISASVIGNIRDYGVSAYALKQIVWASRWGRFAYAQFQLAKARGAAVSRGPFARAQAVCQAVRLLEGSPLPSALAEQHQSVLQDAGIGNSGVGTLSENRVLRAFLDSGMSRRLRQQYTRYGEPYASAMKIPRENDDPRRQGNLVVLKAPSPATREKGVLYLQYTESLANFVALFDIEALALQYRLVLEPSTWGYQDESFLLLLGKELDVVVQAQDEPDFNFIRSLQSNLSPVRLGAGDWADPDRFSACPRESKEYDFVMVASWSPMKRHRLLFESLAAAGLRDARLALIGYPLDGRKRADISNMARRFGLTGASTFESILHASVAQIVGRSRVGVMLSLREGANRGLYECLFCDVPVVLSRENRGVNKQHINDRTGRLASDDELPDVLRSTLNDSERFTPRSWALAHTGRNNAYDILQRRLIELAQSAGEPCERPIARIKSAPYTVYAEDIDRLALVEQYHALAALRRKD